MPAVTRSLRRRVAGPDSIAKNDAHDEPKARENRYEGFAGGTAANMEYVPPTLSVDEPPRFTIDLSLPPEQRYVEVCSAFAPQLRNLPPLFDEVMCELSRIVPLKWIHAICALFLRRVYDDEENRELKGISTAIGIDMYLLVCFNVLLDLFMGCSSGGAAVSDGRGGSKMLHFRTLDWGMDSLRKVVIHLDFIAEPGGPVVASSITYAGYVGVLTGVRKGLSISLNFRPTRNNKHHIWADFLYYWHLALVLFGWRRSISSHLRGFLLRSNESGLTGSHYVDAVEQIRGQGRDGPLRSTACYLCLSDGCHTTVFEKDRITSVERTDSEFIAITNNDVNNDAADDHENENPDETNNATSFIGALAEIVAEAKDRRQCAYDNYHQRCSDNSRGSLSSARRRLKEDYNRVTITPDDIVWLVQRFPTTNETTHYACVMDPTEGNILWCRRWKRPVTAKWIREHE